MWDNKDIKERLTQHLRDLHLPTVRHCFSDEAKRARREDLSHERYLFELIDQEIDDRRERRIRRYLKQSKLPLNKTFDTFDMDRLPYNLVTQVNSLRDGSFTDRADNILAFGTVGSGKSHLLSAIGHELVRQEKRVLFTTSSILVQDLLVAKRELRLKRKLRSLDRFRAILIDDLGYVKQDREEMEVLFSLLAHRYERGTVMITSNLPFSKWENIFKDPMTTAAAIDRLVHHAVILELNLPSYRLEHSEANRMAAIEAEHEGKDQDITNNS